MFNDLVNCADHLGGTCGILLTVQMCVVAVLSDVALDLMLEAIGPLQNGKLTSHP